MSDFSIPPSSDANDDWRLSRAMREVMQGIARANHPALNAFGAAQAKATYEKAAAVLELAAPDLKRVDDVTIPMRDGQTIGARFYAPNAASKQPVLLYFHGGGFTVGSVNSHDVLCRVLAKKSEAAVLSVDYRLAPEHRFPVAVHDSWDALDWLLGAGVDRLSIDPARVAVGGDSAGGTLAAVCAIHARDLGINLKLQMLFYPGTSAHQDSHSHRFHAAGPILDQALIDWFFAQYIDLGQREDWRFAPLLADDVEGVAPAWIGLAESDPLVDEGVAYADKLRLAGVPVDLEIYRGVVHGFAQMGRALPEARQLHDDAAAGLRQALLR